MVEKHPEFLNFYLYETWEADLKHTLEKNPPPFKYQLDYFIYIGQLPLYIIIRSEERSLNKGYISVNRASLQKRVDNYKQYLDYLLKYNLLESDNQYIVGEKSRGLRYPIKYIFEKTKKVQITKKTLIKNLLAISKVKNNLEGESPELIDKSNYPFLTKWFNQKLQINLELVEDILLKLKGLEDSEPLKTLDMFGKRSNGKTVRRGNEHFNYPNSQIKFNSRLITAQSIFDGSFDTIGTDSTSGRFHSPLTRLKKELRQTVTYDEQRLVSVDIVNSQPFFLIGLLDPYSFTNNTLDETIFYYNSDLNIHLSEKYIINKYAKEVYMNLNRTDYNISNELIQSNDIKSTINTNNLYKYNNNRMGMGTIMLGDFISERFDSPEVKTYINWVTNGTFYEKLGEHMNEYLDTNKYGTMRDAAKQATYTILYDVIRENGKMIQSFRDIFTPVMEIINLVKYKNNHRTLSCTMQAFEADIILNHCCKTISIAKPDLPIFTIHDCIVTTQGNEEYVKSIMEQTIQNLVGHVPKFKFEYW